LYNFFGSSNFKNRWRLIYAYMKKEHMLKDKAFPKFNDLKHNSLCSELKELLYVAITRTRQRLWICKDINEYYSIPMLDY
jgi:ATP-dependent exoDNAse (exonuclease V) beta subunit